MCTHNLCFGEERGKFSIFKVFVMLMLNALFAQNHLLMYVSRYTPSFSKSLSYTSRKHDHAIRTPFIPTFIKQNWGMQGYTYFLIFAPKHRLRVFVKVAYFLSENKKNIKLSIGNLQFLQLRYNLYIT